MGTGQLPKKEKERNGPARREKHTITSVIQMDDFGVYQALKRFLLQSCKLTFRASEDPVAGMRCGLNFLDAQLLPYD